MFTRATDDLHQRINRRVEMMFERGLLEETRRLSWRQARISRKITWPLASYWLPVLGAVEHLRGETIHQSRRLMRRQDRKSSHPAVCQTPDDMVSGAARGGVGGVKNRMPIPPKLPRPSSAPERAASFPAVSSQGLLLSLVKATNDLIFAAAAASRTFTIFPHGAFSSALMARTSVGGFWQLAPQVLSAFAQNVVLGSFSLFK